jgi:hypothetical protein
MTLFQQKTGGRLKGISRIQVADIVALFNRLKSDLITSTRINDLEGTHSKVWVIHHVVFVSLSGETLQVQQPLSTIGILQIMLFG